MGVFNRNIISEVGVSSRDHIEKKFIATEIIASRASTDPVPLHENSHVISHHEENDALKFKKKYYKNNKKKSDYSFNGFYASNNHVKEPLVSSKSLPCKTYIACGDCPYRDRCTFLHDSSLCCKISSSKPRKSDKIEDKNDSFYWRPMTSNQLQKSNNVYDLNNQQNIIGFKKVDCCSNYYPSQSNSMNYQELATSSMWSNLTHFCKENEDSRDASKRRTNRSKCNNDNIAFIDTNSDCTTTTTDDSSTSTTPSITARSKYVGSSTYNDISQTKRVNVFVRLASGESVVEDDDNDQNVFESALHHINDLHDHVHIKEYDDNVSDLSASYDFDDMSSNCHSKMYDQMQSWDAISPSSSTQSLKSSASSATTLPDDGSKSFANESSYFGYEGVKFEK